MKNCEVCKKEFEEKGDWQRLCLGCYKKKAEAGELPTKPNKTALNAPTWGMLFNAAVRCHIDKSMPLDEAFEGLYKAFLVLREKYPCQER